MSLKIGQVLSSQIRNNPISEVAGQAIDQIASRDDVIGKGFFPLSPNISKNLTKYIEINVQEDYTVSL